MLVIKTISYILFSISHLTAKQVEKNRKKHKLSMDRVINLM